MTIEQDNGMTTAVIVEAHVSFTVVALSQASGASQEQIHALVSEGLLQPSSGQQSDDWRFAGEALPQTRKALRLARELDLELPAVALVMDLLAENEQLRARLRGR